MIGAGACRPRVTFGPDPRERMDVEAVNVPGMHQCLFFGCLWSSNLKPFPKLAYFVKKW
jgi:hypothetical protein